MNKKTLFLVITLTAMLILVTSVNAATDNTNTSTTHSISEKTTTTEPVVKEKIENTQIKQITKTNKIKENKKTSTKTMQVNNYDEITSTINGIDSDTENDEYIINLNEGTYQLPSKATTKYTVTSNKNITINANNQNLISVKNTYQLMTVTTGNLTINQANIFHRITNNGGNLILNNSIINTDKLRNINNANLIIKNCTLNCTLQNNGGFIIIDDQTTLGPNFNITEDSNIDNIITNNSYFKPEEIPNLTNENITQNITIPTTGNATFTNCQINAKITNKGNLTLVNCSLSNNNMTTSDSKTDGFLLENKGNATLIDCRMENNTFTSNKTYISDQSYTIYGAMYNNGLMNIINSNFSENVLKAYEAEAGSGVFGYGASIVNNGTLNILESNFKKNHVNIPGGGAIYSFGNALLNIDNTNFSDNFGGLKRMGSSIFIAARNKNIFSISNISYNISNSIFNNNSDSDGGAIFIDDDNIGNIEKCIFTNNTASRYGGAIRITQGDAIIKSCTFKNNTAANGILKCGKDDIYKFYTDNDILIDNCTFINNNASDILYTEDNTRVTNCLFENNTGNPRQTNSSIVHVRGYTNYTNNTFKNNSNAEYLYYNNIGLSHYEWGLWGEHTTVYQHRKNETLYNNIFIDNKVTIGTMLSLEPDNITKQENKYINTSIDDTLTLNIPNKIYTGEAITITGTYNINNPKDYDEDILEENLFQLYINGEFKQSKDTINFTITPTAGTMLLTIQPTISQTRKTEAIRATTLTDIIITPENYNEYVYEGKLIGVGKDSKILFAGTFTDKNEISIDTQDIVIDGSNASFTNTIFKLEATGITLQNMKINNTNTEYPIQNTKDNNIITGNTITITNTEGKTAAIYNKASNTEISYNTIYVDGPALSIDHGVTSAANTQAILLIGGDKNIIEYNNIEATSTQTSEIFGTVEAITNYQEATNTIIRNNNIKVTGNAKFNYGINSLKNVQNITITNNNILVTGERYADGIQVGNNAENILIQDNTIKCICQNTTPVDEEAITYGIVTTNMGSGVSNNVTINNNNIDLTGSINYGIEVYQTTNTVITDNIINVNGLQSMGIGYAHSPNSTVTGNIIQTSGDSSVPLTQVTEEIEQANVGIQLQQESDNILIEGNTIQTYDKAGKDTCINITTNNITVKNNNLTSSNKVGDNTITTTQPDTTTIEDNNAIEQNSTTQTATEDLTTGDNTTLTAQFYDDTCTPVGDGKAIFKVNGKTLRDNQGNVIYADVINGRAELPDVNITQEWTKTDTTIQAIYIGDDNNEPITTKPTTVTVTKPEATITLEAPTEATPGQEITLKATVTDGENNITSGRVAFKLNGKTLKDPKTGKALYANVENGIATITYTIPEKTKAKEYVLTAVFTDTKYDRVEAESKLNVVKA